MPFFKPVLLNHKVGCATQLFIYLTCVFDRHAKTQSTLNHQYTLTAEESILQIHTLL